MTSARGHGAIVYCLNSGSDDSLTGRHNDDLGVQERQSLLSKLLDAVKQCQIRFGGRTELATENDSRVVCLCAQFEAVLQHGIRKTNKSFLPLRHVTGMMKGLNILNNECEPVFWQIVRLVLNKHEYERYMLLKNIQTDIGRGRAWLRSALNEHSLERYMHMILADSSQIRNFYEDWAFLLDDERSSMLPMMAAGLGSILFAISIDNPDLNLVRTSSIESPVDNSKYSPPREEFEPKPVISKPSENGIAKKKKKKKRPTSQVVSFDDDDLCNENISLTEQATLTPIGDSSIGELIPIVQNEEGVASGS
ncbi:sorting nexin-29 [Trichonephila clavipes]|nr:sorting nexin-29 [Trichonephila clavipes]